MENEVFVAKETGKEYILPLPINFYIIDRRGKSFGRRGKVSYFVYRFMDKRKWALLDYVYTRAEALKTIEDYERGRGTL